MTTTLNDVIVAYVADHPTSRVPVDGLLRHATAADPTLVGDPTARTRLAAVLASLAEAGAVVLPKARSGWDDRTRPPLPLWVGKTTKPRRARATPARRVWPQALEAAAAIATRPDEYQLLDKIAIWLRNNADAEPVPLEERSLEVLDDEKALAIETTKRLFTTGALTLDLLACYPTPVPFPSQHVPGVGPTRLLVAENNATFHSLLQTARHLNPAVRPDLHIGWGCGNQFPTSITAVTLLDPAPTALYYVGDLDAAGLRIAASAAATANAHKLPPLQPATALYEWLLAHGVPRPDRSNPGIIDPSTLVAWAPEHLRSPISQLLLGRERIAQETLGLRELRTNLKLLVEAVG
ncbi:MULTISPECIES: Wadjet anti-phage system protein JetD domain-containing protein [unclassified Micromonospora]|uniref:Wadjet anti-phage system protein JetD domain-containing protein n=1 Tax=unclassified Micromonospora TaxID=2617518 RepID=UPI0033C05D5F